MTRLRNYAGEARVPLLLLILLALAVGLGFLFTSGERKNIVVSRGLPESPKPAQADYPEKQGEPGKAFVRPEVGVKKTHVESVADEVKALPSLQEMQIQPWFLPEDVKIVKQVDFSMVDEGSGEMREQILPEGAEVVFKGIREEMVEVGWERYILTIPLEYTDLAERYKERLGKGIRRADPKEKEKEQEVAQGDAPEDRDDEMLGESSEPTLEVWVEGAKQTIGGGTLRHPAKGPGPAYKYGKDIEGYVLVKNWDFGKNGTIDDMDEMSEHFQYHDQFGCIANGGDRYGSWIVSPDKKNAITWNGKLQPVEGINTDRPVREFTEDSLKTFLVGLDGSKEVHPTDNKAGNGSFQAKWTLPNGGKLLGMDMIWETRVRYKTPPYFWFAIWTAGNKWRKGAEMDLIESFGWDNGGGRTNFEGRYWHSSLVEGEDGTSETNYHQGWSAGMQKYGVRKFDATDYHIWTWVYKADDTFVSYLDGRPVQRGTTPWTFGAAQDGEPVDMSFIFDGSWGHSKVETVNRALKVSEFKDVFYEWDYSRIYLRKRSAELRPQIQ